MTHSYAVLVGSPSCVTVPLPATVAPKVDGGQRASTR